MSANWIEDGRAALARYRENDTIDQADTDALAEFVEQALVKTTWNGTPVPLTTQEWVVRFDGAVRRYPSREEAVAEGERITAHDIPVREAAGWPCAPPTLTHERRSKLRPSIEASEVLAHESFPASSRRG